MQNRNRGGEKFCVKCADKDTVPHPARRIADVRPRADFLSDGAPNVETTYTDTICIIWRATSFFARIARLTYKKKGEK